MPSILGPQIFLGQQVGLCGIGHLSQENTHIRHLDAAGADTGNRLELLGAKKRSGTTASHLPIGFGADTGKGDNILPGRADGETLDLMPHGFLQPFLCLEYSFTPDGIRIFQGYPIIFDTQINRAVRLTRNDDAVISGELEFRTEGPPYI